MIALIMGLLWHVAVGLEIQVLGIRDRWGLTALVLFATSYIGARVVRTLAVSPDAAIYYALGSMVGGLLSKMLMRRFKSDD